MINEIFLTGVRGVNFPRFESALLQHLWCSSFSCDASCTQAHTATPQPGARAACGAAGTAQGKQERTKCRHSSGGVGAPEPRPTLYRTRVRGAGSAGSQMWLGPGPPLASALTTRSVLAPGHEHGHHAEASHHHMQQCAVAARPRDAGCDVCAPEPGGGPPRRCGHARLTTTFALPLSASGGLGGGAMWVSSLSSSKLRMSASRPSR